METVDPEITATCKDLGAVKKVFQLALLCTKRQPLDRPTMHEVTRVLGSLVPSTPTAKQPTPSPPTPLPSTKVPCYMDEYANLKTPHMVNCPSMSTSDAQLFLKFGEVISQSSKWRVLESKHDNILKISSGIVKESVIENVYKYLVLVNLTWECKRWTTSSIYFKGVVLQFMY